MTDREWIIKVLENLIACKALHPDEGGLGEKDRADYIEVLVDHLGFDVERHEFVDSYGLERPNLIVDCGGEGETLWLIAHMDTVPAGEGWSGDPFKLRVKDDVVYGRGVSDDGIGLVSLLLLLKWVSEGDVKPKCRLRMAFVADEEKGSKYGVGSLIEKGVFRDGGYAIVPDFGDPTGASIEIAEKGLLWLKMITHGSQGHPSMPHKADNAHIKACRLVVKLYDELQRHFYGINKLFDPPYSTFEPTMKERNIEAINIIPGLDIVYWDCRIVPEYSLENVLYFFESFASRYAADIEVILKKTPSYTNPNSKIVKILRESIGNVLNVEPKLVGLGMGTIAGMLRKIGIPSVAWSVTTYAEHIPDEYEYIDNYIKTAKVLADVVSRLS